MDMLSSSNCGRSNSVSSLFFFFFLLLLLRLLLLISLSPLPFSRIISKDLHHLCRLLIHNISLLRTTHLPFWPPWPRWIDRITALSGRSQPHSHGNSSRDPQRPPGPPGHFHRHDTSLQPRCPRWLVGQRRCSIGGSGHHCRKIRWTDRIGCKRSCWRSSAWKTGGQSVSEGRIPRRDHPYAGAG